MATQSKVNELFQVQEGIAKVDADKLLRPKLGEASLEKELPPLMDAIDSRLRFAVEFAPLVSDSAVDGIKPIYQTILTSMQAQAGRTPSDYVAQREAFIAGIRIQLEKLNEYRHYFVAAAIESKGFLKDDGIRQSYEQTLRQLKEASESAIATLKEQSTKALQDAKTYAEEIENKARRTAAKISVSEAQDQFADFGAKLPPISEISYQ